MPTWSTRAATRGSLHRIALAALASIALIIGGGGVAAAQESGGTTAAEVTTTAGETTATEQTGKAEQPPADEQPPTDEQPPGDEQPPTDEQPPGDDERPPSGEEEPSEPLTASDLSVLTDCHPRAEAEVTVFLRTGERPDVEYTVTVEGHDPEVAWFSESYGAYMAVISEVAPGRHEVVVTGTDGTNLTSEADLEGCHTQERPDRQLTVSVKCTDGVGVVTIQVYNPDTERSRFLTITVSAGGETEAVPPYEDFEFFADVVARIVEVAPDGAFLVSLLEEGQLVDSEGITVACGSQTTPSGPSTTPGSGTAPPAQGGTVPGDGGLALTGAEVGGLAALGVLALLLGGVLVLVGRRRRGALHAPQE